MKGKMQIEQVGIIEWIFIKFPRVVWCVDFRGEGNYILPEDGAKGRIKEQPEDDEDIERVAIN